MNILETIVEQKKKEVETAQKLVSIKELEKKPLFERPCLSLKKNLFDPAKTGIIAEFKRKSPSKGVINDKVSPQVITKAYADNGASGISVLTDKEFFGGSLEDLEAATINNVPLLRKDFMISDYQIIEAKAYGASVILLIAACLTPEQVKSLATVAKGLGLEVLLEVHDETELGHICQEVDLIGVNNRNLKTFKVDIENSLRLISQFPKDKAAISESGISEVETIVTLKKAGFNGFLIGENFMRQPDPTIAFADFVQELKAKQ
ncbi:MAG TPA: indole-3-glycerol phosphate synthase TrpC [Flavisolibacter sp.]|nr:indole-3-glycerol phosphate synthase TrpC [Flavisolibacter sp.]